MPTTITAYQFSELSPKARKRALDDLPEPDCEFTLEECMASLKALCKLAGVKLKDWSIGPYSHSWLKVEIGDSYRGDEPEALKGPRALAWIENNIFGPLRQSWGFKAKGRRYTKPGAVPECPLTGVCFDEGLLDAFRGRDMAITLKDRFESLAGIIARIAESELEYQQGEGLEERAESLYYGALFDETGRRIQ